MPLKQELPEGHDLAALRKELVRFALLQLRNREMAEDAVQETFASVLIAQDRFRNQSTFRTWVFSILKNKVIDLLRDRWHKLRIDSAELERSADEFKDMFHGENHWARECRPVAWGNPEHHFESQEFWEVLQQCLDGLPKATAEVFVMREILGLEVNDICKELGITPSNCWVILYRARMGLRLCLQRRWFQGEK